MNETGAIIKADQSGEFLAPVVDVNTAIARYQAVKNFISGVLREGTDYGKIPGAGDKPTLLKPGAEKMCAFFGFTVRFQLVEKVEDWTGEQHAGESFFYYQYRAQLWRGEKLVAEGDGSANSWEKKYRYRNGERVCPNCGKPAIKKSKFAPRNKSLGNAPGWYCFDKAGGCGAEFAANDAGITNQEIGQVKNPDAADVVNTLQKMAQKRALIAPVLIATNTSDYFTQDIEDFTPMEVIEAHAEDVKPLPPTPQASVQQQNLPIVKPSTQPRTQNSFNGLVTPQELITAGYAADVSSAVKIINELKIAGKQFLTVEQQIRDHLKLSDFYPAGPDVGDGENL